jgi:predicted phage tail protein
MKTIVLHGQLGKEFGKKHKMDVKTAAEAVRALIANFPAIERFLLERKEFGYRVKVGREVVKKADDLANPIGGGTISFTPVIVGAGGSFGQILLGAAIIGAAFFTGGASLAASGFLAGGITTTFFGGIALAFGASLIVGGVTSMLAPKPKTMEPGNRPENKPSYNFNGPVNTIAQGNPVPVGYGRMIVGGAVISAGITTEEI